MIQDASHAHVSLDGIIDSEDVFNEVIKLDSCRGETSNSVVDPARLISVPIRGSWHSLVTVA